MEGVLFTHMYVSCFCLMLFFGPFRDGFRSRLENIVRGQSSSNSDAIYSNMSETRSDVNQENNSIDAQHESYEQGQIRGLETDVQQSAAQAGTFGSSTSEIISWQETSNQGGSWQEQVNADGRGNWQPRAYGPLNQLTDGSTVSDWQQDSINVEGEDTYSREAQGIWHQANSREAAGNWSDEPSGPPRNRRGVPFRRFNRFHPSDDDNVYSMELRELLSR